MTTTGLHLNGCLGCDHDPDAYPSCWTDEQVREDQARFTFGPASRHVEQPGPIPNNRPSIQSLVRADLEEREQVGIQRYGTPLQAFNGRDALRDAYEEALDLACYLRQAMAEREVRA